MSVLAALLFSLAISPFQAQAGPAPEATAVPDVEVFARPTSEAVQDFVGRIAAPSTGRGLARWRGQICPGVANLGSAAAQAIVDRISLAAADVNLGTGEPGCDPNIVIIFTPDGRGLAQEMVARDAKIFRQNVTGLDRGAAAFRDFQNTEEPVRWWSLSLPVDRETGQRAIRVPGDAGGVSTDVRTAGLLGCSPDDCAIGAAPVIARTSGSRLVSPIVDDIYKTIIIVDIDKIGAVNSLQLGDYLAFIGLAQIDAQAETSGFDTVLNLFTGGGETGLTAWDRSYLATLYGPRPDRASVSAQASAVANIMTRDRVTEGLAE